MNSYTSSLLYGTEIMTYTETFPSWFLLKLKAKWSNLRATEYRLLSRTKSLSCYDNLDQNRNQVWVKESYLSSTLDLVNHQWCKRSYK